MITIGIDISKDTFDVCVLGNNKNPVYSTFTNDDTGYFQFFDVLTLAKPDKIGFESTGVYHKRFLKFLEVNGYNAFVLSPRSVSLFIRSQKINGKTDKTDSYGIALYLQKNDDLANITHPCRDSFKPILTTLTHFDKQINQIGNLLHSVKHTERDDFLIASIEDILHTTRQQKDDLKRYAVQKLYREIPSAKLIQSEIIGVGDTLLLYFLPLIYDNFDKYTVKQIQSFLGLNPVPYESGTSVKRFSHISHRGDNNTRKILFMSAISSVRSNPILREKFQRLVLQGKPKKVALMAIMTHIVRAILSRLSFHTGRSCKK